jgi:hypothetical protein
LDSGVKLLLRFELVSGVGMVRGRGDLRSTTFLRSAIPCLCLLLAYPYNHLDVRFLKPPRSRVVCRFLDSGGQRAVIWVRIGVGIDIGGMDLEFFFSDGGGDDVDRDWERARELGRDFGCGRGRGRGEWSRTAGRAVDEPLRRGVGIVGLGLWVEGAGNLEWGMMKLVFVYRRIEMGKIGINVPKTARLIRVSNSQRGEDHPAKRRGL